VDAGRSLRAAPASKVRCETGADLRCQNIGSAQIEKLGAKVVRGGKSASRVKVAHLRNAGYV
jgi:hypothetical protein